MKQSYDLLLCVCVIVRVCFHCVFFSVRGRRRERERERRAGGRGGGLWLVNPPAMGNGDSE